MTRNIKSRNRSITIKWIFSYVLIAVISLTFFFASYITSGKIISEQTQQFNEQVFDTTAKNTVDILNSMRKISYEISTDSTINIILTEDDYNTFYSDKNVINFRKDIAQNMQYNDVIEIVYVYVPESDCVVSDRGVFDTKTFYNTYINETGEGYERWKDAYAHNSKDYFIRKLLNNKGAYASFNMRVSPNIAGERKTGYVSVIASEDEFFGTKYINSRMNSGDIYIYDNNGELLISRNISGAKPPQKVSELKNIGKDKIIISDGVSIDAIRMYIAISVPKKNIIENERALGWFFTVYLLLQVLIIVPLIMKMVKANYTPIREILNIFNIKSTEDEYKQLHQCIKNVVQEKQTLEKENRKHNNTIKQNKLSKILVRNPEKVRIKEELSELGIEFKYNKFAVIGLEIDDPNRLFDTYEDMTDDERYSYLMLIISNVFEEALTTESSFAYVTETENILACISNFDGELNLIEKKASFAVDFIYNNFGVKISYLFSGVHDNVNELYSAYREMMSVFEYKLLFEMDGNFAYDTTSELSGVQYAFGHDMEQKFITFVKNGSYEDAKNIISKIFENIKAERNVSREYVKILMFDIIAALLKTADTLEIDRSQMMIDLEIYEERFASLNLDEFQKNIMEYVRNICEYIAAGPTKDQNALVESIKEYVAGNYSDPTMCVVSVGEAFGMTGSYLSKKFKAVTGEFLVNYISKYRIDVAKRLMRETNYNRDTIAEMVGIGHPRTFNRLFKKNEGITPTEYKEKISKIQ